MTILSPKALWRGLKGPPTFSILSFILLRMILTQPQVMPFRRQYLRQSTPILFRIYLIQQLTQCPKRSSFCLFNSTDLPDIIQKPPGCNLFLVTQLLCYLNSVPHSPLFFYYISSIFLKKSYPAVLTIKGPTSLPNSHIFLAASLSCLLATSFNAS